MGRTSARRHARGRAPVRFRQAISSWSISVRSMQVARSRSPSRNHFAPPSCTSRSNVPNVSPSTPQPRLVDLTGEPIGDQIRSGDTWSPNAAMSSPVLATTARRSPRASSIPAPASRRPCHRTAGRSRAVEARDADARMLDLVPRVDGDQQRQICSRIPRSGRRNPPAQPGDPADQVRHVVLGLTVVSRQQDVLVHLDRGSESAAALTVCRARRRSRRAAPSPRPAGPLSPATRPGSASPGRRSRLRAERSCPPVPSAAGARRAGWRASRIGSRANREHHRVRARRRFFVLDALDTRIARPACARSATRAAASAARPASRDPMMIGVPAIAHRRLSLKPSAPLPLITATVVARCPRGGPWGGKGQTTRGEADLDRRVRQVRGSRTASTTTCASCSART